MNTPQEQSEISLDQIEQGVYGWVSINDALPPEDSLNDVLICLENGDIGIGYFITEGSKIRRMSFNKTGKHIDWWKNKPTHWMQLPEPPKPL